MRTRSTYVTKLLLPLLIVANMAMAQTTQWTWITGANTTAQAGVYGTKGVANAANTPGARDFAQRWQDGNTLWLFGGTGHDVNGTFGWLNDLWKYNTSARQWTWVGGDNTVEHNGVYGTMGTPAAGNQPGSRAQSATWTDGAGNLWLFGGFGRNAVGQGRLNDLWKYNTASGEWTWMKGENTYAGNSWAVFGTQGVAAAGNTPGGRQMGVGATDASNNLWLFGGYGSTTGGNDGDLNDLWMFNTTTNNWTWMKGSNIPNAFGVYGTKGTPDPANTPGARESQLGWTDGTGNMWVFGGYGKAAAGAGFLNDLWQFNTTTQQWTWMHGDNVINQTGIYGTKGTSSPSNKPGARFGSASATDASGKLVLFGGFATVGNINDLWKYNISTNEWTWTSGDNTGSVAGVYGTQGTASAGNKPGSRQTCMVWGSSADNIYVFGGEGGSGRLNDLWQFGVVTLPSITSFTPTTAPTGSVITITGTNFTDATAVSFGATAAQSFTVNSSTEIVATVGTGESGNVRVTTPNGTDSKAGFTYCVPPSQVTVSPNQQTNCQNNPPFSNITASVHGGTQTGLSYQWYETYFNPAGVIVPGATSSTLIPPNTEVGRFHYVVEVSGCGSPIRWDWSSWYAEVEVNFKNVITASAGTHGTIYPTGVTTVCEETSQFFSITADPCYYVASVTFDGMTRYTSNQPAFNSYYFESYLYGSGTHTISAAFAKKTYNITLNAGQHGAITGAAIVNCDDNSSYMFVPDANYHVEDILVDGVSIGAVTSYAFSNVSANHTISASFALNDFVSPTLSVPFDIVQVTTSCSQNIAAPNPTYSDNIGVTALSWVMTGATRGTSSSLRPISFVGTRTFKTGITTITYTAKDAAGNQRVRSFTVTVSETTPPSFTCPAPLSVNITRGCKGAVSVPAVGVSDNCGVKSVTWVMTGANTGVSPATGINRVGRRNLNVGVTEIAYTAKDAAGNTATCTQVITVTSSASCGGSFSRPIPVTEVPGEESNQLIAKLSPNPTTTTFTLQVKGKAEEAIQINVYNSNGQIVQQLRSRAGEIILFGESYQAGTYLIEVGQGEKRVTVVGVKASR